MRFDVISWDQTTNNLKKPRLDLCIRKSGKPNRTYHSSRYLKKEIGFLGKRSVPLDCTRDIGNQVSLLRHLEKAVRLSEALVLLQDTLITRQPAQQKGEQAIQLLSNCSGSSWRSGAQAPYRSRLGWSVRAFGHVLSSHTGSFLLYLVWELRSPPFYLIKSLYNCTSATPISSVPLVKRFTIISLTLSN